MFNPTLPIYFFNPLSTNPTKWSNTLKQFVGKLPTNCLSVFGHFVKLARKGLKSDSHPPKTFCIICFNESPLKIMNNASIKNDLIRKLRLISKFMTSQTGKQKMSIWILPNQTMKLGHLIKYNVRNIFLQNSYKIRDRDTSSRPLFVF